MTAEELRTGLRDSRERLFAAIRGLSEEQFRFVASGDAWNIAAHLAHLLRIERVYAERGSRALIEDEPYCASTSTVNDDDPVLAQRLAIPQMIHGMQAARRDIEALLDAGDAVLARTIKHERIGRMTIEEIVKKMADHEREHGESIAALSRQAINARRVTIPLTRRS
jgi:uncharacterized damage-inducible protein DinB